MKSLVLALAYFLVVTVHAQVQKVWIGDTTIVYTSIYEGDTLNYVGRNKSDSNYLVYYDTAFQKPALHWIKSGTNRTDTNWYPNGQLKRTSQSQSEICLECWQETNWYSNGTLKSNQTCNEDSCIRYSYYQSGLVKGITKYYVDTLLHPGMFIWCYEAEYYENGQKKYDPGNPNGPTQTRKGYYSSGKTNREFTLYAGSFIGLYSEWYENGNLKVKGQYPSAEQLDQKIKRGRIGTWSYYNESGKLIKEEFYEEGKLVKTVEY